MTKPKNKNSDHDSGITWMSVSDLMTGLIFIFVTILINFSIQYKKEQINFVETKKKLQKPAKTRQHILEKLQNILEKKGLYVEVLPEEGILRLSESVLSFPPAKAFPQKNKLRNIGLISSALTEVLSCHSKHKGKKTLGKRPKWCRVANKQSNYECPEDTSLIESVLVEGHTDSSKVRYGTGYRDNLSLSAARATTVLRLLRLCDSNLARLYNPNNQPLIGASGYSFMRPIIRKNTKDPRNRRIDIRLVMELPENALENISKNPQEKVQL